MNDNLMKDEQIRNKPQSAHLSSAHLSSSFLVPLIFLIVFTVYYVTATPLMDDSDVPWHLATGKLLLKTHHVPTTDPWSFASNGQPWYLLSWIWDALLGATERCFGLFGVLVVVLAISASIPALIAGQLLRTRAALPAIFFTVMIASLCIMDFITARPHLGGYVMALVFYVVLHTSRSSSRLRGELEGGDPHVLNVPNHHPHLTSPASGGGKDWWLLWLPPLMLVWANMHGSFIAGFSVLGAFVIEAYATKQLVWLKRLIVILLACGVCAAINPYGLDVILGAMRSINGVAEKYNTEWLPFAFSASAGVSAWLILFILASNLRGSRAPIADKILAVGWLVGMFFAMRNGPIFIILSAPYLATCLDEATESLREVRAPSSFMLLMQRQPLMRVWLACIVIFVLFVSVAAALPHQDKIASEDRSVSDAIDYALEHYPAQRYLTDYNFGGQVIYRAGGKLNFFMDSRAGTVYSRDAMADYLEFMWQHDDWEQRLSHYGVNALMIGNQSLFAKSYANGQHQDRWQLVFAGKRANVYIGKN